ncbi:MAG TPA: hypothetical protein VK862_08850 [Afifellaceae bacterium]|nr:hypothetical protein [Afifellaceae bacterium]
MIVGILITMMSIVLAMSQEAGVRYGLIKASPVTAPGIVTAAMQNKAGAWEIIYEFDDRTGRPHIGKMLLLERRFGTGEAIDVEYFSHHPDVFHPKAELDREGRIFVVFMASVFLLAALILQFWRSFESVRKFNSEGQAY